MFQLAPDISAARNAAADIIALLDTPSTIEQPARGTKEKTSHSHARIEGRIEARDIHFAYPLRPTLPVLKDLNFTVEPGQYIAFVGASGSGKSTMYVISTSIDES